MALFVYLIMCTLISILFEPEKEERIILDKIYDTYPMVSMALGLSLVLLVIFVGARVLEMFWNRLIADILAVREIDYQEALAMVLFLSIWTVNLVP